MPLGIARPLRAWHRLANRRGSYNQTDAEGFLRIQGLPSRVQGGYNALNL